MSGDGSRAWDDLAGDATPTVGLPGRGRPAPELVDDRGATTVAVPAGQVVELTWRTPVTGRLMTITRGDAGPLSWTLEAGGPAGPTRLDPVVVAPRWPDQTMALDLSGLPDPITGLRLSASGACTLRQIEVLGDIAPSAAGF